MTSFIVGIYEYLKQHRLLRNLSLLAVTVCLGVLVLQQTYKEDISDFLPLNNKYQQALDVYQDLSGANRIITIFQFNDSTQADPDSMIVAIADFEQRISSLDSIGISDNLVTRIDNEQFAQIADFVYSNIPYFLTDADYARIDSLLADDSYIKEQIASDKHMLMFPISGLFAENFQRDPLNLFTPAVSRLQSAQPAVNYELYDGYIFSHDMNRAFAMISSPYGASETEHNSQLLQMLQQKADETMEANPFPHIDVRFIGAPVIAVGNAQQIKKDSLLSVLLAIILILGLLYWVFRNVRNMSLIAISIAWGWIFAMGLLAVFHDIFVCNSNRYFFSNTRNCSQLSTTFDSTPTPYPKYENGSQRDSNAVSCGKRHYCRRISGISSTQIGRTTRPWHVCRFSFSWHYILFVLIFCHI